MTLHPILIPTKHDAGLPLTPGALVSYHGRRLGERNTIFYVTDVDQDDDEDGYTIVDKDYPGVTTLHGLDRSIIRPTGDRIDLCDCGHEAGRRVDHDPTWCTYRDGGDYCGCERHTDIRED